MALDSVLVPCGFEESLVALDCSSTHDSHDWSVSEIDYSDTLGELERENIGTHLNADDATGSGDTVSVSWCRSRQAARRAASSSSVSRRPFLLWSPRLRLRDERKRVLKISLAKLRHIDDPESCLRRSVLLSNTLRGLQRQAREENLVFRVQTPDDSRIQSSRSCSPGPATFKPQESAGSRSSCCPATTSDSCDQSRSRIKRRRTSDLSEEEAQDPEREKQVPDCPSPEAGPETPRLRPALRPCNTSYSSGLSVSGASGQPAFSFLTPNSFDADKQFSCGQSSLFGELQSVVFHSLITSLES